MANSLVQPFTGDLVVDLKHLDGVIVDLVPGAMRGLRREKDGIQKAIGEILLPEIERRNRGAVAPLLPTSVEIVAESVGALVSVLGSLREQLHDNCRQLLGNEMCDRRWRTRRSRDVRVHEFERILGVGRWTTGEHFVKRCAKSVKIGTMIDGAADATGLLWRDVRRGGRCQQ